jgi:hypothetical protein
MMPEKVDQTLMESIKETLEKLSFIPLEWYVMLIYLLSDPDHPIKFTTLPAGCGKTTGLLIEAVRRALLGLETVIILKSKLQAFVVLGELSTK